MTNLRILSAFACLSLLLGACAPGATGVRAVPSDAPSDLASLAPVERTAWEAWHLMQIGYLRTGTYNTSMLVDLPLPQGVKWTVVGFEEGSYALNVSGGDGGAGYRVDPAGVRPLS